jgi:hypothetical protein
MAGREKVSLALVAVVLLAAVIGGCGDDGDSTSTDDAAAVGKAAPGQGADSGSSGSTGKSAAEKRPDGSGSGAAEGGSDDGAAEDGSNGVGGEPGGESNKSGSSKGSSKDFRTPGGDNSVQDFGTEAGGSQLAAASAVVEAFMVARAEHDWAAACKYLAAGTVDQVEKIIAPGEGCAATLTKASKNLPENGLPNTMTGPIDSFRVEGNRGFALWHGNDGVDYTLPLKMEGGWKLTLFEPTAVGSPATPG